MVPIDIAAFGLLAVCVVLIAVVLASSYCSLGRCPPRPGP